MSAPTTSAVYTVWRTLERLLKETTFPITPEEPNGVKVWFGDYDAPPADAELSTERVVIAPTILPPDETWGPIGQHAREEAFSVFVYVRTMIPGRTYSEARDRLEALTSVVENMMRDINASRRDGLSPAEFSTYPSWHMQVGRMFPLVAPTTDGIAATAEFEIRCSFRIGTP